MTHAITRTPARPISRFIDAQRVMYPRILREIQQGRKRTHWMWFVFPQLRALGRSETARYYGIADKAEALAYLDHPVLRARLGECTIGVLGQQRLMFNDVDRRKLHASMTLFREVVQDRTMPDAVLSKFFGGLPHQDTLDVLAGRFVAPPQTAMGRVEMGRHWEKGIARARAVVQSVGQRAEPDRPMLRPEVEAFVRGFNLSLPARRQIIDKWMEDQNRAHGAGWDDAYDSYM